MTIGKEFSWILVVVSVIITIGNGGHTPSPHRFDCPPKKGVGGLKDIMQCATKFKFMLDQICQPKYGLQTDLIMNLLKHVFFHAIKCIDEDYEHFLIDGVVDCFVGDDSPGQKMMCNIKQSVCDVSMQGAMVGCAMKEAKLHTIDMAKMMSQLGHLSKLCQLLADGTHRECKAKWKDFPPLPK